MSTDQYTPDELAFLDKALVGIATGLLSDPEVTGLKAEGLVREALALLDARRKIRGPAEVLDEAGADRLDRLVPFYASASRLVGLHGDDDASQTHEVMAYLEGHLETVRHQSARLIAVSLENDSLKRRVKELEAQRTPPAPIANDELAVHEFVCNKDVIRGAYFWEGGLTDTRAGIAFNGCTMGLEYIPKQLSLNQGDIVEIRVIERADR